MRQHANNAMDLVGSVGDCLDVLMGCGLHSLKMKDLKEISDFVTTIESALKKRAKEEGGEYPVIEYL